jgi:hypothetical protein
VKLRRKPFGPRLFVSVALLAFGIWNSGNTPAQAGVVYGNLGSSGTDAFAGTNSDITSTDRFAQGFSTGASSQLTLQAISLPLFFDGSATQQFSISILADNQGVPGSLIAGGTSNLVTIGNTGLYTFLFTSLELQAQTSYWIAPGDPLSWYITNGGGAIGVQPAAQNGSGYSYVGTLSSTDSGSSWSSAGLNYGISVTAVPEPATMQLLVSGAAVAAVRRVVRKRAARA